MNLVELIREELIRMFPESQIVRVFRHNKKWGFTLSDRLTEELFIEVSNDSFMEGVQDFLEATNKMPSERLNELIL